MHHTLTYNAPGFPRPDPSTYDLLPPDLAGKFDLFEDRYLNAHAAVDGAQAQIASAQDDADAARSALDNLGPDADERVRRTAEERLARARARLEQKQTEAMQAIRRREEVRVVALACARLVESARTYEPMPQRAGDLQHVAERGRLAGLNLRLYGEVAIPKGVTLPTVSAEIDAHRAHRAGIVSAPPTRDSIERDLLNYLDRAARRGGIEIDLGNDGLGDDPARQPAIVWPLNNSARLDVEALLARHCGDGLREEIRAGLDQRYAGIEFSLDPHEKARKLKETDARLLELERIECALTWQAIRNGEDVFFRPDANARAVLGVA